MKMVKGTGRWMEAISGLLWQNIHGIFREKGVNNPNLKLVA